MLASQHHRLVRQFIAVVAASREMLYQMTPVQHHALVPSITLAQAQARLEREGVLLYWGHLVQHFPAGGHNGNELPDKPMVL